MRDRAAGNGADGAEGDRHRRSARVDEPRLRACPENR